MKYLCVHNHGGLQVWDKVGESWCRVWHHTELEIGDIVACFYRGDGTYDLCYPFSVQPEFYDYLPSDLEILEEWKE